MKIAMIVYGEVIEPRGDNQDILDTVEFAVEAALDDTTSGLVWWSGVTVRQVIE